MEDGSMVPLHLLLRSLSDGTQQRHDDVIGKRQAKTTADTKEKACGNSFTQKKA